MEADRDQRIREIAYELWERAGRPAEGADSFWYQAERQLVEEAGGDAGLSEAPEPYVGESGIVPGVDPPLASDPAEAADAGLPASSDPPVGDTAAKRRAPRRAGR